MLSLKTLDLAPHNVEVGLEALRCDGLVEVCYELAGVEVWGRYAINYPIQTYLAEHNNLGRWDPLTEFSPVIQRGPNEVTRFVDIQHAYEPHNLP